MKSTLTVATIALGSFLSALLISRPDNPRNKNSGEKVHSTVDEKRKRADSLLTEIHNDSVLYCVARLREDSIRSNATLAFNR